MFSLTFCCSRTLSSLMRAVAPLVIGAAGGGLSLSWWLRQVVSEVSGHLALVATRGVLQELIPPFDWSPWRNLIWNLGSLVICWELRHELLEACRLIVLVLCYFLSFLLRVCSWAKRLGSGARGSQLGPLSQPRSERDTDLTCMAAVAAPAYQPGTFLLVSRPPDWDEIWVAGVSVDGSELIGRTTAADGSAWMWTVVRPVALSVAAPVLGGGARRAPAGIPQGAVNWICVPPACDQQWNPDVVEVVALTQEANRFVAHMQANPGAFTCNQAGVGGALVEAVLPAPAMAPGGAGVGAGLGNPGAVGLGLPAAGGGPSPSNAELKALEAAVTQLQQLALDKDDKKKKDKDKGKRRKKSRKKSKKSKKKKKKKSKRSSSSRSSSSRSSRSRSRSSSSTSSSSSGKGKPLKWREHGKDQKVSYSDLAHVDQLRLKKRGDLLAFAAKSPGALTAHFLAGIYARLSKGSISRSSQLREASAVSWAHQFSGLSEVRDQKEVLTLCEILDHINRREIARALDVLCQRIVAIQQAKAKGGSWEKAEALELVTNQRSLAASSMLALTNS